MADPYQAFVDGVPDAGAAAMYSSPLSPRQQYRLASNNAIAQSGILQTLDQIDEFKRAARSKVQGARLMQEVGELDPANDPYYDQKVMRSLSRNPDALLDRSVNGFLSFQGRAFERAEGQRNYDRRVEDAYQRDAVRQQMMEERQTATMDRAAEIRGMEADQKAQAKMDEEAAKAESRIQRYNNVVGALGVDLGGRDATPDDVVNSFLAADPKARIRIRAGFVQDENMSKILTAAEEMIGQESEKKDGRTWKIGGSEYTLDELAQYYTPGLPTGTPDKVKSFIDGDPKLKAEVEAIRGNVQPAGSVRVNVNTPIPGAAEQPMKVNVSPDSAKQRPEAPAQAKPNVQSFLKRGGGF